MADLWPSFLLAGKSGSSSNQEEGGEEEEAQHHGACKTDTSPPKQTRPAAGIGAGALQAGSSKVAGESLPTAWTPAPHTKPAHLGMKGGGRWTAGENISWLWKFYLADD